MEPLEFNKIVEKDSEILASSMNNIIKSVYKMGCYKTYTLLNDDLQNNDVKNKKIGFIK